jgi:hypothetical protein
VAYRFFVAFFFPPLAVFFAIVDPPFRLGVSRGRSPRLAAPRPFGTPARVVGAHRLVANSRDAGGEHQKKGVSTIDTPETGERPLALLRRLLLAALRSLFRHYSSLECGSSALLPVA